MNPNIHSFNNEAVLSALQESFYGIYDLIVSYAIAHTAYPKMSGRSLWAVLERIGGTGYAL